MGFKSPTEQRMNLADHKGLHLQSISLPIGKLAVQIDSVAFCQYFLSRRSRLNLARCCGIPVRSESLFTQHFAFRHCQRCIFTLFCAMPLFIYLDA